MPRTTVYLVRHGEQDPSTGHADGGLSARGREQAQQLGRRLASMPITHSHHSRLLRAAETAAIIADHLPKVPMHACELVADRTHGTGTRARVRLPRAVPTLAGAGADSRA